MLILHTKSRLALATVHVFKINSSANCSFNRFLFCMTLGSFFYTHYYFFVLLTAEIVQQFFIYCTTLLVHGSIFEPTIRNSMNLSLEAQLTRATLRSTNCQNDGCVTLYIHTDSSTPCCLYARW